MKRLICPNHWYKKKCKIQLSRNGQQYYWYCNSCWSIIAWEPASRTAEIERELRNG